MVHVTVRLQYSAELVPIDLVDKPCSAVIPNVYPLAVASALRFTNAGTAECLLPCAVLATPQFWSEGIHQPYPVRRYQCYRRDLHQGVYPDAGDLK